MFWAEKRAEPWFAVCHAEASMLATRWDQLGGRKGVVNIICVRGPSASRARSGNREPRPTKAVIAAFIPFPALAAFPALSAFPGPTSSF